MRVRYPITRSTSTRWALWSWLDIPSTKDVTHVYLRRLRIVQTPWFGLYIHWINEPDSDRDPHDHPWWFWSLILRGSYVERIWGGGLNGREFVRSRWSTHSILLSQAHQIVEVSPGLVSLVFVGRRAREWGFWTEEGRVLWRQYERS